MRSEIEFDPSGVHNASIDNSAWRNVLFLAALRFHHVLSVETNGLKISGNKKYIPSCIYAISVRVFKRKNLQFVDYQQCDLGRATQIGQLLLHEWHFIAQNVLEVTFGATMAKQNDTTPENNCPKIVLLIVRSGL